MKHIVYRGRLRTAVVNRIEFKRDVPVPVRAELAERLLKVPDFYDVTPVKTPKTPKAAPSEPVPAPVPAIDEQTELPAGLVDDLWAR